MKCPVHFQLWIIIIASGLLSSCRNEPVRNFVAEEQKKKDSIENQMVVAPGKKPLRLLTERPYNLETPLKYFLTDLTPNDVFFVRWHLPIPPDRVSEDTFRLRINGNVSKPLALSMNDLRTKFTPYKMVAVLQCAGNSRSRFNPRVPGAQWVNGSMGNAEWTGVKVKDVLAMAGAKPNSKFVSFNGLDRPVFPASPDFVKSLEYAHAIDGEVMIAYEMNGEPIPLLNGYPLKLVVPGWYSTYWMKMLNEITVTVDSFKGFWMQRAYLVPKGVKNGSEKPKAQAKEMVPISKMDVRSLFIWPEPGTELKKGKPCEIQGLAFDDGTGIAKVEISLDKGTTWTLARLDPSLGRYSWRRWRYTLIPQTGGEIELRVKATNASGETQPEQHWNRSGYMKNDIESLPLTVIP